MKKNKNPLYLVVLFVATTGIGVVLGKCLQPAPVEDEKEMVADSVNVDTVPLIEPVVTEEATVEEKTMPTIPAKEVDKKSAEPIMTAAEFKQNVHANSFDYKRDFHGGNTPRFVVYGQKEEEEVNVSDIPSLRHKLNMALWDDFEVTLDYDKQGKISVVYITAVYH